MTRTFNHRWQARLYAFVSSLIHPFSRYDLDEHTIELEDDA